MTLFDEVATRIVEALNAGQGKPLNMESGEDTPIRFFGFDSLEGADLAMELEDRYGVVFDDEEWEALAQQTLGDLIRALAVKSGRDPGI